LFRTYKTSKGINFSGRLYKICFPHRQHSLTLAFANISYSHPYRKRRKFGYVDVDWLFRNSHWWRYKCHMTLIQLF